MRMRRDEMKNQKLQMRSKAQLPKELLKHISGREQTVQELNDSWFNRIKATINLNNKETSFFDMLDIIKNEEKGTIGRRFALVRMFLALMFLSNGSKLTLVQDEEFKDFSINLR